MNRFLIILLFVFCFSKSFSQAPSQEYSLLIEKADSLFESKNYKVAAIAYSAAFKSLGWKGTPEDRYSAACVWTLANY